MMLGLLAVNKIDQLLVNQNAYNHARKSQHAWANTTPLDKIIIKSNVSIRVIPTAHIYWLA